MALYREEDIVSGMTEEEMIRYAISKLRTCAKVHMTAIENSIESKSFQDIKDTVIVIDPNRFLTFVKNKIKDLPNIEWLIFEGYLVDMHNNMYLTRASDALMEIARRIEQTYIYNVVGSQAIVPRAYLDADFIYQIAKLDINDLMCISVFPVSMRVKFKDEDKKQLLSLSETGLVPAFISDASDLTEQDVDAIIEMYANSLKDSKE